jgi:hypothetical protein
MLGSAVLSVVFALARIALVLQIQYRQPTATSIMIQIAAGGLLAVALGIFLTRLLSVNDRRRRRLVFAACFVAAIPGLASLVSLLSISLQ